MRLAACVQGCTRGRWYCLGEASPILDIAVSAARVASIVEHRSEPGFVLLLQLADRHFCDAGFEDVLADSLRDNVTLIERWMTWSADQRWTPSAYVEETILTEPQPWLTSSTGWPHGCPGER
jgi:hypothetical protein